MHKKETIVEALCTILIKHHVIPQKEKASIIKGFNESSVEDFEEFLIDEGLVDDINILRALGEYYQLPTCDVIGRFFDHQVLRMFPKSFLLRKGIIPLETEGNVLIMVVSDPQDPDLLPEIGEYVSDDIRFNVGLKRAICDAVKEFYDKSLTQEAVDDNMMTEEEETSNKLILEEEEFD